MSDRCNRGAVQTGCRDCAPEQCVPDIANDCNHNGIPDHVDILVGHTADLNLNGVPDECEVPADFNHDGYVDAHDYALFNGCMAGPDTPNPPSICDNTNFLLSDLNGDHRTDLRDFAKFQRSFTGGEQ